MFQTVLSEYTPKAELSDEYNIPIFIARAELDSRKINETIYAFKNKSEAVGANVILYNHISGKNGFYNDL